MVQATDQPRKVISVQGLWAGYEGETVLEDVNLSVRERDFVGIIGPNGGGKTTLLRVLLGLLPPMRGVVRILGQSPQQGRRHIGYVPQYLRLDRDFPISVWDVTRMGRLGRRRLLQRYTAEDDAMVADALDKVQLLNLRHRPIGELSGGQRQRAYIARALAGEPQILLLDEPTASVDPTVRSSIYELLRQLNERVAIVLISHDIGAIASYVKTVGCLNRFLFYQMDRELTPEMLELAYQCPVDLIAHGVPHRVFPQHREEGLE
ncbi:MAG: metal ABC transporter ATP-binding protein [Chloroflexota bacterium]